MSYTTYEIFLPDTLSDRALGVCADEVLRRLNVSQPKRAGIEFLASVQMGLPPQPARLTVSGRPNAGFAEVFHELYGMTPCGSIGIDTEAERYQGCRPIGLLVHLLLPLVDCDLVVTLNDGGEPERWSTIEILRRSEGELIFAAWHEASTFREFVLRGSDAG